MAQPIMEVVSTLDPAIDYDKTDLSKYADTRDISLVVETTGQQCVRFFLQPIPTQTYINFVQPVPEQSRIVRSFQCAVKEVHNLSVDGGMPIIYKPSADLRSGSEAKYVADEDLNLFSPAVVTEIGAVAHQLCFLQRATGVTFPVEPTLRAALVATRRGAAHQKAEVVITKKKPSKASAKSKGQSSARR